MEKISIVRRRLEIAPTRAEIRARKRMEEAGQGDLRGGSVTVAREDAPGGDTREKRPGDGVDVDLSPQVLEELWSGGHLEETPSGKRHFIVEAQKDREDGNVVLRMQFMKPDYYLRLLNSEEVCEMLHISKSTLYTYVHEGSIRTYRMGRSLRFRFQDVLEFLTGCQSG